MNIRLLFQGTVRLYIGRSCSSIFKKVFSFVLKEFKAMNAKVRQSLKEAETLFNERMDYYFN